MATAKNMSELEKLINQKIAQALNSEVKETVKTVMQSKVESEVYDAYESGSQSEYKYERRGEDGGLKDRDNMIGEVKGNTLEVENIAKGKDKANLYLAGLVEYGHHGSVYGGYDYPNVPKDSKGDFRDPRPFVEETRKALANGNELKDSVRKGLNRQGIKTK
jgi:hypothetical protein